MMLISVSLDINTVKYQLINWLTNTPESEKTTLTKKYENFFDASDRFIDQTTNAQ